MSSRAEDGPVYYREIQKNAYLKRIPDTSKMKHLSHKRAPPKAMWTQFCVHNGRTPYLEQYPEPESPCALAHRPTWRVNLKTARHVTASVRPWPGDEFDFLVATEEGAVRMLAPDWESMQDWVSTLRNKLHELKVLGRGENVYCAPPAPPAPRAGTRDPNSPLPPTPAGPAIRVPGIEPTNAASTTSRTAQSAPEEHSAQNTESAPSLAERTEIATIPDATELTDYSSPQNTTPEENLERISDWDTALSLAAVPTTSADQPERPTTSKKIAKICGQNICLDDSILKRNGNDSDEEFFAEIDRINKSGDFVVDETFQLVNDEETLRFDERIDSYTKVDLTKKLAKVESFKQRMVVSGDNNNIGETSGSSHSVASAEDIDTTQTGTNITVIKVSNSRGPPHTAIPVMGSEVDVFDFEFKQKLSITNSDEITPKADQTFVNIVNTEGNVHNGENGYGTIFNTGNDESPYGHISLTTTVKLTGDDEIYERLCLASTSDEVKHSPRAKRKYKENLDKFNIMNGRKTSLPNLEIEAQDCNPTYEYLFLGNNNNRNINIKNNASNFIKHPKGNILQSNNQVNVSSNSNVITKPPNVTKTLSNVTNKRSKVTHSELSTNSAGSHSNDNSTRPNVTIGQMNASNVTSSRANIASHRLNSSTVSQSQSNMSNLTTVQSNLSSVTTIQSDLSNVTSVQSNLSNVTTIQSNPSNTHSISVTSHSNRSVERSHSQNTYDVNSRLVRERPRNHLTGGHHHSPRRESGTTTNDKQPLEAKLVPKGLFKRGLTELSFLSRLKGLGQNGKQAPREAARVDSEPNRVVLSPTKVVRRSRPDTRPSDGARRRSSSLSGDTGVAELQSLRRRQAAALRTEQARGAAHAARLSRADLKREPPVFTDAHGVVWVASWGRGGAWFGGRAGDRIAALNGVRPRDAAHARQILRQALSSVVPLTVDVLFHRVPHAKIYVLNKEREEESIGIKLDSECGVVSVEVGSPAARAGIPPTGPRWALTEVNNRPIDLLKGGEDEMSRLSARGTEVSVLIQPLALVQKLRSALKTHRILLSVPGLANQIRT